MQTNENNRGDADQTKHPRAEEWMGWLYGEVSRADGARLKGHLNECGQCRADVKRWQRAQLTLDLGKVEAPERVGVELPWLKWGIAAGLMLVIGFGAGRNFGRLGTTERASLKGELRAELFAELQQAQTKQFAEFKASAEQKRVEDDKFIAAALNKLEAGRVVDYASLRKELETVAVLTQDGLQQAQQEIVTLASYPEPTEKTANP